MKSWLVGLMALSGAVSLAQEPVEREWFGITNTGAPVEKYTLNNGGYSVEILTLGATIQRLYLPDRQGELADVVLGLNSAAEYQDPKLNPSFGCIVGRYANRIAKGQFTIGPNNYQLAINNPPNSLHGGVKGFCAQIWQALPLTTPAGPALRLSYQSHDGEEGFPGNLDVEVTYTLTKAGLQIDYVAHSDQVTVVNLTNHTYWNLAGHGNGDILKHHLELNAPAYTPADDTLIPTGEQAGVEGTPFDFTAPKPLGQDISHPSVQRPAYGGYDHNFVLAGESGELRRAARLYDPNSGRGVEIQTTEPGVQLYTGNWLDLATAKDGKTYGRYSGVALECQHFPDSPNQPGFPSTRLEPGQTYRQTTVFKFFVQ